MIEVINLEKRFNDFLALKKINLKISKGECFGLVGPNGAGKTTLLRILCGALKPTSGIVKINGYNIAEHEIKVKSMLGYLPEEPNLYERLTARSFLYFFADLYGVENKEATAEKLLKFFGLYERADDRISAFSKGMRQRLAIARALIHDPEILLLDEPTMGLDPSSAMLLRNYIKKLKGEKTILICTHYMPEAEMLCDRIAIIYSGEIIATGSLEQLRKIVNNYKASLEEIFIALVGKQNDNFQARA